VMADLVSVCTLAKRFNARVFIDESHAVGVFGENGRGVCELLGVEDDVDIIMGTFSKSFASIGGFITAKADIVDFIKHTASPHIFSASLPPASVATVLAVLDVIEGNPALRGEILAKAEYMARSLREIGYDARFSGTQIVPVVFGNEVLSMAAYKKFMEDGVYVNPILPPAVPESASGFRTSYIATHEWDDLERALGIFKKHRPDFLL
jgi:8-amino-7-oxononanoate synthase